ncbi:hypothetical protein RND81_03G117200 [Saponaria officinalis]|uniref:F-box domain-containing protein n=1 Tax=Saponaria officinalis TaxID=3572 RepID=A0AAW1LZN3_SAPOF
MKTIPQELLVNILSRLPAKSIARCRCVWKPWRCLLSEAHFIKAHLDRTKEFIYNGLLMLISSESNTMYRASISYNSLSEISALATELSFAVSLGFRNEGIPSCNRLMLIEDGTDKRLLVNPTTKEVRALPVSPYALDPRASFTMYGLEYDHVSMYGLGYDHVSDDYKVVTLSYYYTDKHELDSEMFVNVYSVRSGTWKKGESSPYDHAVGHVISGVFFGGRIHWLARRTSDHSSVIVGFDLTEEKFHEVPAPSSIDGHNFVYNRLVVLGGCLSIFPSWTLKETDVWMLKEYGVKQSWTKFSIPHDESDFTPLVFMAGQREVVVVKDERTFYEKLVMYNLDSATFKDITVNGIDEFLVGGSFTETLVSPYHNHEAQRE